MQTGFLHLHKATVILFLAIYILKLIALLLNNQGLQAFFAKKGLRILEMVVSTLFLVTGVFLITKMPSSTISSLLIIKICIVVATIPMAVIGFKRGIKWLAALSVLGLIAAYGLAEMNKKRPVVAETLKESVSGADIFISANCQACHGEQGNAMVAGAKDLSKSALTDAEIEDRILNGKNSMPAYKKSLNAEQVKALVEHVKSLRK